MLEYCSNTLALLTCAVRRPHAQVRNRWLLTNVLLIDEISMIDADLFDKARAQHWTCYAPTFQCAHTLVLEQRCCPEC